MNYEQYEHAQDPRVIITSHMEHFIAAAKSQKYSATIWQRPAEFKRQLVENFHEALNNYTKTLHARFVYQASLSLRVSMAEPKNINFSNYQTWLDPVAEELKNMAVLFNAITRKNHFESYIAEDLHVVPENPDGVHQHEATLNCTWLADGTFWYNEYNKRLQVPEGDLFFFKEGFPHGSPPESRLTIINH